ncbi:MAG TPA: polysaccharide deacetylase family protein [Gammaproteobacteria bacterium]|nr:polysaccharide deacetylase family protein [Gammaproteobacteria bacterium]
MTSLSERTPYQAIIDRPKLTLPGGGRLAIWIVVNVEEWSIERPMPRTVLPAPMGQTLIPDVPNWAWHEYGMRAGFWRIHAALMRRSIPVTMAVNGNVCNSYPRVAAAARDAGWEFMGHGFVQRPMHHLDDERETIADTISAIEEFTSIAPTGWESPGLTETEETLDLLAEAGIDYVANWVLDDLPVELRTATGSIIAVPYTVETNDIVVHAIQHQPSDGFKKRCLDQFARLYHESSDNARVMAISVHPYLTGVPHRIGYFEELLDHVLSQEGVVAMTGSQIAKWYREAVKE